MKTVLALLALLLCTSMHTKAQDEKKTLRQTQRPVNEIDISYYNTHIGQNIAAEYNRNFGNHTLLVGVKCHLNRYVGISTNAGNNDVYRKHFYARRFSDFIGATLGYEYHLRNINPYVSPYLLFNVQYAQMPTKHFQGYSTDGYSYNYNQVYDGPFIAIENTMGAGLSIKLCNRLALNQSIGLQVPFIYDPDPLYNRPAWTWDGLDVQWRMGLTMAIN